VTPTGWLLGIEALVRALISDGETAERCYQESIGQLGRTQARAQLARAHLLYGEWLRRCGRRVDARGQLRTAHGMLDAMGMAAFAERARRELLAAGEPGAGSPAIETSHESHSGGGQPPGEIGGLATLRTPGITRSSKPIRAPWRQVRLRPR
jgi:hypothetical protein